MVSNIIYTKTDEAPALATQSLLPIIRAFTKPAKIEIETKDISLAARIISKFPDFIQEDQRIDDSLAELAKIVQKPEANIIKLPNISASIPQLLSTIKELQNQGISVPEYPDDPSNKSEADIKSRYDKIKGSAVNPILREGNSDRRAPKAVKEYARRHPHSMGSWNSDSESHVATMNGGDFRSNEQSITIEEPCSVRIVLITNDRRSIVLKDNLDLQKAEIIDGTLLEKKKLLEFLENEMKNAKEQNLLFSLHMKATMMKVSDPIIFGHAVKVYFKDVFEKHKTLLDELGVDANNGFGVLLSRLESLNDYKQKEIETDIQDCFANGPDLAMVNSDKGITNLHVPSDVIIDASMPAMIRTSGKMWNAKGEAQDTKAVIPDSTYAQLYAAAINFCKEHGAFDPQTMGTVPNVGLMAQKAEEYGSHDKTFEIEAEGVVRVIDTHGNILMEHAVNQGDIWRMCQVKDTPIQEWVKLAVNRSRATATPAIFWLDESRAHDAQLITKVKKYLNHCDTEGLDIRIMSLEDATRYTLERLKNGKDTISVTGNVLRDYLTDLFPILELGTSAKMLSIVPLMNGGGLFETGAGGSAPKHVQQFNEEGHLRWDSLGEFLALSGSLEHLGETTDNKKALVLADTLEKATGEYLLNNKSPSRKVGELDNRGSHFYLTSYWAQELVKQTEDPELSKLFTPIARKLTENEDKIVGELNSAQGHPIDLNGYYYPDDALTSTAMRPSTTLNSIIDQL